MYSVGSIAPSNARDFSPPMPPDHISPVSSSSAQSSWERQSYNNNGHSNNTSRDRFPSSGKKEIWSSEHRSSSQRYSSSSSASFSSNNKRRTPGRHGAYENGRYGVTFSRPLDSSSIRSSENGKAERDTFILSGGYVSSPNADKYIKDIDGLHFRDTHVSPVDARTASSPHYDPIPRNGSQNSFEIPGSREGERLKSSNSHYSYGLNHRDQDFREKNVGRPDHYRRICHLPKIDSSREWNVENKDVLEGRIDRYGSASNREPLFSEVYKDQSHKEWRNKDRGLYSGLSSRVPSYPSKSHSRDIGVVSPSSEVLGIMSLPEDQMMQNSHMHDLHAEESVPNSKKRPRLTWGQGLAKYEKEKIEEDPSAQKKNVEIKILEESPLCQKKSDELKTEEAPSPQSVEEVHSEKQCAQNGDFQSQLRLSGDDQLVKADPEKDDSRGEQFEGQEQCKKNEDLQPRVNVLSDEHMGSTGTEMCNFQQAHCDIEGLCMQNGKLQSEFNHSDNEDTIIADSRKNDIQEECCHTRVHEPNSGHSTEDVIVKTLAVEHANSGISRTSASRSLHEHTDAISFTELPDLQCVQELVEKLRGPTPRVCNMMLTKYVKQVEIEIDSLEKQLIKLENEQGCGTGYAEKMVVATDQVKEIRRPDDENSVPHPKDSCIKESPELLRGPPAASIQPFSSEIKNITQSRDGLMKELPDSVCSITDGTVQKQRSKGDLNQKMDKTLGKDRLFAIVMSSPKAKSSEIPMQIELGTEDITETNGSREDMVSSILHSNQEIARQASDALSHLYQACFKLTPNEKRIYGVPQETDVWEYNSESHQKRRKILKSKIIEKKKSLIFAERALIIRNRVKKELWKHGQVGCLLKDRAMDPYVWSPEQKIVDSSIRPCSMIRGFAGVEANQEEVQLAKKLLKVLPVKERGFLRMPSMILGKDQEKLHSFETNNALVEDPIAAERERMLMNPWSAEEKRVFLEKYLLLGKNLRKIATFLEHKTVADCVQFYYLNQKSEDFEKVHRKHVLKKRRDSRSNALYLATTISSSRQHEADAACMEGLSLVAAAAAAMSSSRVVRASFASSKAYRDRTLNKPALGACVSSDKAGNGEQIVSKTPRSWNSRSYRGLNGDSEPHWTDSERELFLKAVPMFGKDFHNISLYIGTKNQGQCKTFFSKARKRLGLDQLVEIYKAAIEAEKEQKMITVPPDASITEPTKHDNAQKSSPDVKLKSAFLTSGLQCSTPCTETVAGIICAGNDLKLIERSNAQADHKGEENVKTTLCMQDANKQELIPDVDNAGITGANRGMPAVDQALVRGEFKPDFLNVKTEPLVLSNLTNVSSNATSSLVHVTVQSVVAPALAPNTPSVSSGAQSTHIIQPTHVKERTSKGTEPRTRREPTSWTQDEKDIFIDVLKTHGKNWERLRERLPAKSLTQIKTYFQNSKARLTLECEGVVNGNGRAALGKRKSDDSDSNTNPGSGGQGVARKAPIPSDDGNLKVGPGVLDGGGNATHIESRAFSGRNSMEESINAQKSSQTAGLNSNPSASNLIPKLNAPVYGMPNPQHSYVSMVFPPSQQLLPPMVVVQSESPLKINQPHHLEQQQAMSRAHAELLSFSPQLHSLQQLQANMPSHHQVEGGEINELGPSFELQKQQLQLAISNELRHARKTFQQAQSSHPISPQAVNQVLLTTTQGVGSHFASANNFSPIAYQSDLHQSQLYQVNGNPQPALSEQQEQVIQPQIMHLQWQQQHSQLQQVQSQALMQAQGQEAMQAQGQDLIQANECRSQSEHQTHSLMNDQDELDRLSLIRSQQSVSQYVHVPQISETAIASQAMADVHHVKLFGQSLFLQSDSSNQQPNSKVTPTSSPPTSWKSQIDDSQTLVPNNALNFNHPPSPPFANEGSINELEPPYPEMSQKVAQLPEKYDSQIVGLSFSKSDSIKEDQIDSGALQNAVLSDSENMSCEQPRDLSDRMVNRIRDESVTAVSNGQPAVAQALPRVIDALVALAEWRVQNSCGDSGKLTDEFLSQSWEALQRDPSAFLEAGKASESLAQLCSGGAEMLQQLKDGLIQRRANEAERIKAGDIDGKNRAEDEYCKGMNILGYGEKEK